jgi:hypothetical protein
MALAAIDAYFIEEPLMPAAPAEGLPICPV